MAKNIGGGVIDLDKFAQEWRICGAITDIDFPALIRELRAARECVENLRLFHSAATASTSGCSTTTSTR